MSVGETPTPKSEEFSIYISINIVNNFYYFLPLVKKNNKGLLLTVKKMFIEWQVLWTEESLHKSIQLMIKQETRRLYKGSTFQDKL